MRRSQLLALSALVAVVAAAATQYGLARRAARKYQAPHTGLFFDPEGLAIDAAGQVYVADEKAGCLFVLSPDLELVARIEHMPDRPGISLTRGGGIAAVGSGRVILVDATSQLVELELTGPTTARIVRRFGLVLDGTEGIQLAPDGRLFVAEEDRGRILQFSPEGALVGEWALSDLPEHVALAGDEAYVCYAHGDWIGRHALGTGELLGRVADDAGWDVPDALTVGPDGLLYVMDQGNHRIVVVRPPSPSAPQGEVVRVIGRWGHGPGELHKAEDMVFDRAGRLIVADGGNGRLQVFDPQGGVIAVID